MSIVELPARLAANTNGRIGRSNWTRQAHCTLHIAAMLARAVRPLRDGSADAEAFPGWLSSDPPLRFAHRNPNHILGRKLSRIATAGKADVRAGA